MILEIALIAAPIAFFVIMELNWYRERNRRYLLAGVVAGIGMNIVGAVVGIPTLIEGRSYAGWPGMGLMALLAILMSWQLRRAIGQKTISRCS